MAPSPTRAGARGGACTSGHSRLRKLHVLVGARDVERRRSTHRASFQSVGPGLNVRPRDILYKVRSGADLHFYTPDPTAPLPPHCGMRETVLPRCNMEEVVKLRPAQLCQCGAPPCPRRKLDSRKSTKQAISERRDTLHAHALLRFGRSASPTSRDCPTQRGP
jgi:hypothetical protein